MAVNPMHHFALRSGAKTLVCAAAFWAAAAWGQNPSSAINPYFGSVTAHPATDETLKLSLDDAVRRGLDNNLGLKEAESGETALHGERNQALQGVFAHHYADRRHRCLPAQPGCGGIRSRRGLQVRQSCFRMVSSRGDVAHHKGRLDRGAGQLQPDAVFRAGDRRMAGGGRGRAGSAFAKMSARGEVVQQVATAYLHAIAASSEVDNAKALVAESQVLFDHAHAAHEAGTAANLDELRAKVELQAQQQALIDAQNAAGKRPDPAEARDRRRSGAEDCAH